MHTVKRTRTVVATAATAALAAVALATPASAGLLSSGLASKGTGLAPVQPWLASQLGVLKAATPTTVLVHGTDLASATKAVQAVGLRKVTSFDKVGVVVATGLPAQVQAVRAQPGVTYVEGNRPIEMLLSTSNKATRGDEARNTLTGANGTALDGKGVSVAVIDSGVDPTHPFLQNADGTSAVVKNLKMVCEPLTESTCAPVDAGSLDTDLVSGGGHGMHVNGIVAGRDVTLADGTKMHGAAPGASLVSISTGAVLFIIGADAALNWVLENHNAPCGAGVSAATCPPIKVTSNSYGPTGGGAFDPNSATVKIQRELVKEGVVSVWANGNDGGDGSEDLSNPPGKDPTPGILSVASFFDQNTGTRDGTVSDFSSRGKAGDKSTYPDISAPGEDITSSCRIYLPICSTGLDPQEGGDYNTISGTSMATPHISGIVAQLFQANPAATPAQIEAALESTAYKYTDGAPYESGTNGTTSFDKGHGLVDVVAAANAVR
ncbi:S8 family serine peptidase [Phycicoccus sp. Soil803]|uniref:S8 family peptidase n=1 Tax=Phycicoccus sp. Soil803 TaxID=1736415 RepID=UPI00070B7176|nr:S8 family serine peptidase [Phycicoccus sp. Soil803]KRF24261.1 peptidase S8 [Phycicoccus sp. Soil803]